MVLANSFTVPSVTVMPMDRLQFLVVIPELSQKLIAQQHSEPPGFPRGSATKVNRGPLFRPKAASPLKAAVIARPPERAMRAKGPKQPQQLSLSRGRSDLTPCPPAPSLRSGRLRRLLGRGNACLRLASAGRRPLPPLKAAVIARPPERVMRAKGPKQPHPPSLASSLVLYRPLATWIAVGIASAPAGPRNDTTADEATSPAIHVTRPLPPNPSVPSSYWEEGTRFTHLGTTDVVPRS